MSKKYAGETIMLYVLTKIKEMLGEKVTKEEGKVLTSNDFTTELKNKLDGIAAGATKVIVDSALNSTSTNAIQNKAVNTALGLKAPLASPTFTGTPKATTAAAGSKDTTIATTAFVTNAIAKAVAGISTLSFEVVSTLPTSGKAATIYLKSKTGSANDVYDEYIWVNNKWELIGTTSVDLSGYLKASELVELTTTEIDNMLK